MIEHLREFFDQAKEVCGGLEADEDHTHNLVEMCLLVTQCFEVNNIVRK